jgi:structural maintenance of chromosome 1
MQYLRDKRFGMCTFLPLDTLTTKPVDDKFRNYVRGARLALDVIEYAQQDERAMLFACGSTLICDDMDIAKQASFGKGQEVKVVTLDGSTIHKSGLMAGGVDARQSSKKWDDHEVANLKKQAEHYRNKLRELVANRPKQANEERLQTELSRLEGEVASASDDLSVTKNKLKDIQESLKHAEKQVADVSAKVEKVS